MNSDLARDLLLTEEEGHGLGEHMLTPSHLQICAACREEFAALAEAHALLARGIAEMTEEITPSAAFWNDLRVGLDIAERKQRHVVSRAGLGAMLRAWRRRLLALGALAVLLGGGATVAAGGPQHAWAAVRAWLYTVPFVGAGLGQVEQSALIATGPVSTTRGAITLTVDGLVAGRHVTLVAYHLSGRGLAVRGGNAPVADAVDAVLVGAQGRRYLPAYWQPTASPTGGTGVVTGLLAFQPLAPGERSVRLEATRLPLAPPAGPPWTVTLAPRPASAGTALASIALDKEVTHHGVRLVVTDVTLTKGTIVLDMESTVVGSNSHHGVVVSLTPEQAVGEFAPMLSTMGARLWPLPPALTAPVRVSVLPHPEFVYGPLPARFTGLTFSVAAVGVREEGSATLVARAGQGPSTALVGHQAIRIVGVREVAPPAALGLDGERRLRITLGFPVGRPDGSLDRIDTVIDGVRRTISREDPRLEVPLTAGQHVVTITLRDPVLTVQGPWILPLHVGNNG